MGLVPAAFRPAIMVSAPSQPTLAPRSGIPPGYEWSYFLRAAISASVALTVGDEPVVGAPSVICSLQALGLLRRCSRSLRVRRVIELFDVQARLGDRSGQPHI